MPIISFSSEQASGNLRERLARWPDGRRDQSRLAGVASVQMKGGFTLEPGEKIFTVGSCFARNIEARLADLGFDIVTRGLALPEDELQSDSPNEILNKYAPHSILNEFRWALEPGAAFPRDGFVQVDETLWHDPHSAPNMPPAPLHRVRERRAQIAALYRELPKCRVVVMTLGLVEAWWDKAVGLYLNGPPPGPAMRREPDRFRLDVLSVGEVEAALTQIHRLLDRFGHPDFRLIVTVSPVPLKTTYRGSDVLAANAYSKSALRAAVESLVFSQSNVDYCPSYEIVTLTSRTAAYQEDNRHVAPEIVDRIVDQVVRTYAPGLIPEDEQAPASEDGAKATAIRVRKAMEARDWAKAERVLAALDDSGLWEAAGYEAFEFRMLFGGVLVEAGKRASAEIQFDRAIRLAPNSAIAWHNLGFVRQKLGRNEDAEVAFRAAAQLDPACEDYQLRLAKQLIQNGKLAQAERVLTALGEAGADPERTVMLAEIGRRLRLEDAAGPAETAGAEAQANPDLDPSAGALREAVRDGYRMRDYAAAAAALRALLPLSGEEEEARLRLDLGVCLLRDRRTADGVKELLRAVELDPSNARGHFKLGLGLSRLGRIDEACEAFEAAVRLQPDDPEFQGRLGIELQTLGRFEAAETHLKACLAARPDDALALEALEEFSGDPVAAQARRLSKAAALAGRAGDGEQEEALLGRLRALLPEGAAAPKLRGKGWRRAPSA